MLRGVSAIFVISVALGACEPSVATPTLPIARVTPTQSNVQPPPEVSSLGSPDAAASATPDASPLAPAPQPPPDDVIGAGPAARASNAFTLDLYARLRPASGNFLFSGPSAAFALAMVEGGARGETRAELDRVLHAETLTDVGPAFAVLLRHLNALDGQDGVELHVANRLWGQRGTPFAGDFLAAVDRDYGAALAQVDFVGAPVDAVNEINRWVATETHDRIPNLLEGPLSGATRLVATNAVYFKGKWVTPFSKTATKEENFFTPSRTVKTQMMSRSIHASYAHVDGVQVVELPYRGGLSMLVALPDEKSGLPAVERNLPQRYPSWREALQKSSDDVDLKLPKWSAPWRVELGPALKTMGMHRAFGAGADLSGICTEHRLRVDAVIQKTFVEVNEEGTEAAAATGVTVVIISETIRLTPPPVFHADHPFLYAIRDPKTDAILFMGHVVDPR
jgi:serpin B